MARGEGGSAEKHLLSQSEQDACDLAKMGYMQELLRDMGGFSNFALSFSVISILTGTTQLYGYGLKHGGPLEMTAGWTLVAIFTITVAMAMAELASAYPTAGALYHWSSFLGGRTLGWVTACFNTIGQFAVLAGIDFGLAQFLTGLLHWSNTFWVTNGLYAGLLLSHAVLNHYGIRLVAWLNNLSAWYHIGVVALLVGSLANRGFAKPASFLFTFNQADGFHPAYSMVIGLLLAQWTLTGFDASAHVSEETVDPRRNAPWGIFLAVVISAAAGLVMLSAVTLSIPDLAQAVEFGDNAFIEIIRQRLGPSLGGTIVFLVAGAMWLCGLAALTSASRMVYAFARDGGLPFHKAWAKVSRAHQTPSHAIWGLTGLALLLALSVGFLSTVVSIATIALSISYGLPILARLYFRFRRTRAGHVDVTGPWNLGRLSNLNAAIAVGWIMFIIVDFVLPPNEMAGAAIAVFSGILALIWFGYTRRHFPGPKFHV